MHAIAQSISYTAADINPMEGGRIITSFCPQRMATTSPHTIHSNHAPYKAINISNHYYSYVFHLLHYYPALMVILHTGDPQR